MAATILTNFNIKIGTKAQYEANKSSLDTTNTLALTPLASEFVSNTTTGKGQFTVNGTTITTLKGPVGSDVTSTTASTKSHKPIYLTGYPNHKFEAFGSDVVLTTGGVDGALMTGQLTTSYKNSVVMGSYCSSQTSLANLIGEVRYSSGVMGSASLGASTHGAVSVPASWYNFIYSPHRSGGLNGAASGDNTSYGNLLVMGMTGTNKMFKARLNNGTMDSVQEVITSDNILYDAHEFTGSGTISINNSGANIQIPVASERHTCKSDYLNGVYQISDGGVVINTAGKYLISGAVYVQCRSKANATKNYALDRAQVKISLGGDTNFINIAERRAKCIRITRGDGGVTSFPSNTQNGAINCGPKLVSVTAGQVVKLWINVTSDGCGKKETDGTPVVSVPAGNFATFLLIERVG